MDQTDFYNDQKFCIECNTYVRYLISVDHSYCIRCGARVRLFSEEDWEEFNESLQARRPKGGRPRKGRGKESA